MRRSITTLPLLLLLALNIPGAEKEYPITQQEQEAYRLLQEGRYVKAREAAQTILAGEPSSFVALYVMGTVYGSVEGSLPRAHYYLERAKDILEKRWGQRMASTGPWQWHVKVLWELIAVAGNMDRREEQLELLKLYDELYQPKATASYGWPLMKLGRIEEGRKMMETALQSDDAETRLTALNTLGAMETESDRPERAYEIFNRLLEEVRKTKEPMNAAFLRNAGAAALTLQKYEEAERLLLEATRVFSMGTFSNPWKDLARVYLAQGRFPEALDAVREMQVWSHQNLPALDQQSWAERQTITAGLFDECGFTEEALDLMRRVMNRPDRRGGTSIHMDQSEAGNLVLYRHLLKIHRERLAEEMSWCPLKDWVKKWLQRLSEAAEVWVSGRRAAALTVRNERLAASIRLYAPDSIDVMDSARPELNEILGAGVVGVEAERLLKAPGNKYAREKPMLLLMLGESQLQRGLVENARQTLGLCISSLPNPEVLLRARAEALLGRALEYEGNLGEALSRYQEAMQREPGVIRSLGFALPVRFQTTGGDGAALAASMLARSPRFRNAGRGFTVRIVEDGSALVGSLSSPDGTVLCQVRTAASADRAAAARLFCEEFHRRAFAARIDLAQTDIASIEGSNLTGEAVRNQIRDLFQK